jgi:predicted DNA-binding transcriptional regulator YafY
MDRFDRIFDLHKLLSASRLPVSRQRIEQELECSRATAKRIIEAMRLYLNAPIKYDRKLNGYYYDRGKGEMYELPGVWFSASELQALLNMQQLLGSIQPGLLEKQLAPLRGRIEELLKTKQAGGAETSRRIRILQQGSRPEGDYFQALAGAVASRKRLQIGYCSRSREETTQREISPQRLIHYRGNWYLDAFCHLRNGLRTFALDAVRTAITLPAAAKEIPDEELDRHYSGAYGIFAGNPDQTALLRFSPEPARWVAQEQWHPRQEGHWMDSGHYELRIPYHDPRELVMDILRYGPDVEVLAPENLRILVSDRLKAASALYNHPENNKE